MTESFPARLRAALDEHGPLCVGIDPHAALLEQWGLGADADGIRAFGLAVVEAAAGRVGVVKPQVAFFERYGSRGFAALEDVMSAARAAGLIVIADAKRGDIGSTMAGYASAWFESGSPLEADALTVSPYLGPESLRETLTGAVRADKGVFVLAATSNPEAAALQTATPVDVAAGDGETVARRVARDVTWVNDSDAFAAGLGPVGLVIGATVDRSEFGLDDDLLVRTPILAPGFGAQGATPEDLTGRFGPLARNVLASESRSILGAGPDGIAEAIRSRSAHYLEVLRG
ncbi:orotidine-5'-phosphate decarboxylase [Microbacterium esteraromaticum]|uniref:Orotidine-5'-phosphate decarboxylase n=1 Tax=Microbacterium esteraromaticum TaxID=57043 RepID=A0A939DY39_9MICO|nr:orotidine-5'-phosphate decarboxylase [Microbacterium esteraromaticum]MBN8206148.1 orotidine-5'-phosphate decarboxylase [Microbacterium esteraromaticum]MBN8416303.1 orotidine-5'-phosphate decarboxylase [Microbacterium esteraromaticum]MCA1306306.1 orotidine-5'-phosphate decarboxylase [Microbacterium esteraromaticum]